MSQFARPEADILIGQWEDDGGGSVDLWDAINEVTASDADFIRSETILDPPPEFVTEDTLTTIYVTRLSAAIVDPGVDTGFKIQLRMAINLPPGPFPTAAFIELRQNYVDEITQGILIASRAVGDLTEVFTDFTLDLTELEASQITDFSSLFFRFRFGVA